MLTTQAMEDREWEGLVALREILGDKRQQFVNSLYPTSISDSELDRFRRVAVLAALIAHHRQDVLDAATRRDGSSGAPDRVARVTSELDALMRRLRYLSDRLLELSRGLESVQWDLHR